MCECKGSWLVARRRVFLTALYFCFLTGREANLRFLLQTFLNMADTEVAPQTFETVADRLRFLDVVQRLARQDVERCVESVGLDALKASAMPIRRSRTNRILSGKGQPTSQRKVHAEIEPVQSYRPSLSDRAPSQKAPRVPPVSEAKLVSPQRAPVQPPATTARSSHPAPTVGGEGPASPKEEAASSRGIDPSQRCLPPEMVYYLSSLLLAEHQVQVASDDKGTQATGPCPQRRCQPLEKSTQIVVPEPLKKVSVAVSPVHPSRFNFGVQASPERADRAEGPTSSGPASAAIPVAPARGEEGTKKIANVAARRQRCVKTQPHSLGLETNTAIQRLDAALSLHDQVVDRTRAQSLLAGELDPSVSTTTIHHGSVDTKRHQLRGVIPSAMQRDIEKGRMLVKQHSVASVAGWNSSSLRPCQFANRLTETVFSQIANEVCVEALSALDDYVDGMVRYELDL